MAEDNTSIAQDVITTLPIPGNPWRWCADNGDPHLFRFLTCPLIPDGPKLTYITAVGSLRLFPQEYQFTMNYEEIMDKRRLSRDQVQMHMKFIKSSGLLSAVKKGHQLPNGDWAGYHMEYTARLSPILAGDCHGMTGKPVIEHYKSLSMTGKPVIRGGKSPSITNCENTHSSGIPMLDYINTLLPEQKTRLSHEGCKELHTLYERAKRVVEQWL